MRIEEKIERYTGELINEVNYDRTRDQLNKAFHMLSRIKIGDRVYDANLQSILDSLDELIAEIEDEMEEPE